MPATAPSSASVWRFENFELDVRSGELRKRGVKLRLQGQPLQVLAILLQNRGNLVTREEIRTQIWPADTFVDFDHSLHNAVARIREVLGDSAETPRYVETLPRRGYRFIASVEETAVQPPKVGTAVDGATVTPVPRRQTKVHVGSRIGLLVLMVIGSVVWFTWIRSRRPSDAPRIRSIAVLPLDNFSGDPSQDYFVDGMTDELITDLAKISALRVTSRTSIMRYKGTRKSLPEIARELNVDGIVEGSVSRSGQRVRVTAQLLRAPADQHLWAETYERDLGDVLRLQSEVAQAIAQQIRVEITPQQQARLRSARLVKPEAYDAYLKGRYYLSNQFTKAQPLNTAKTYFEEAIRKDPEFALAYSGLADSYVWLAFFGQGQFSTDQAYQSAKEAIRKTLELDDSVGEVHDTLGLLHWRFEWNWDAAEQEFERATEMAPNYSCAHEDRTVFLSFIGRRAEALTGLERSKKMDPGPSSAITESATYYQLRDYKALVEASREGVASNPSEWTAHANLGIGYEGTGKLLEAISEYQRAVEISGGNPDAIASLAHAYAIIGKKTEAKKILRQLQQQSNRTSVSPYLIATIYAGLGDKDRAFESLSRAFHERSLEISWHLKGDLRIDNLRSDPRFQVLLRLMHLPT